MWVAQGKDAGRPGRTLAAMSWTAIVASTTGCMTRASPPAGPLAEVAQQPDHLPRVLEASEVHVVYYPTPPFREIRQASGVLLPLLPFASVVSALLARAREPEVSIQAGERIRTQYRLGDPRGGQTVDLW